MPDFKALIERLKINEGFRSQVYKCSEGFDTIGYGFAIKDLELTEEEATLLLANRVAKKHLMVSGNLDWYSDMPPEIQGVIIEMVYQMGFSGFTKFKKAITHMKEREWQLAAHEMLDSRWAKQTPNRANQLAGVVREHG
tara:strand:- start:917 stop:1333 length:417 start_codon:yes stop_codon:yes gene_type:complete